jgi:hypothetical protein
MRELYRLASDDVICFLPIGGNPALHPIAVGELARRKLACTEAQVAAGRAIVTRYDEYVKAAKARAQTQARSAAQSSSDEATAEAWRTAGKVADGVFNVLMMMGAGYAVGQGMRPPPPAMTVCQFQYNQNNTGSVVCR